MTDQRKEVSASLVLQAADMLQGECGCMQCQHGDEPCKGNLAALSDEKRRNLTVIFDGEEIQIR